ncbi:hypothetical protein [Candidatus Magnetaquiglobus chichijimensis]|uniref:hypothetical protein n=1 Tax=Candidatus Magnetaquiglobus chichijimensis TaxID=3141448 RepID=UPI003B9774A6
MADDIYDRLVELYKPVGDADILAMLGNFLADVQTNGDDPATLAAIQEYMDGGGDLSQPLQSILNKLLSGDLEGAIEDLGDMLEQLQVASGTKEEIVRLEGLLRDGASRTDATINDLYEQIRNLRDNGEDPARIAQLEQELRNRLHESNAKQDQFLTYDRMTSALRAELDRLRNAMVDPARIKSLEQRLDELIKKPPSSGSGNTDNNQVSVSIVRSLPCIVGFKRKKPSNLPDMSTVRVVSSGLLMAEVATNGNLDYKFDFLGKGFSGFSGRIPGGVGKQKFVIDYSVGGSEIRINSSGTDLELGSRKNLFVSAVARYKTRTGQVAMSMARTDRQVEFMDETMPTAVKSKEEVFVEYEVYKIYPNWDTEKSGSDWYIDKKPVKIIYKVWLVFMDPKTGSQAGNAGYEYRTEQFTVQPPTGNHKKEPNEKVGEDPGKLWA